VATQVAGLAPLLIRAGLVDVVGVAGFEPDQRVLGGGEQRLEVVSAGPLTARLVVVVYRFADGREQPIGYPYVGLILSFADVLAEASRQLRNGGLAAQV